MKALKREDTAFAIGADIVYLPVSGKEQNPLVKDPMALIGKGK